MAASCLRRLARYSKWLLMLSSSLQCLFQNFWMTSVTSTLDHSSKTRFKISQALCTFAVALILLKVVSGSVEPRASLIVFSSFVHRTSSAKINISYSILFNLTTSYSSYFGGKKGISRNKTSFFLLMLCGFATYGAGGQIVCQR